MAPSLDAFLVCDLALADAISGRASVLNIVDGLLAPRVPAFSPRVTAVSRWIGPVDGTWLAEVRFIAPSGDVLNTVTSEFVATERVHYVFSNVAFLKIPAYGMYRAEIRIGRDAASARDSEALRSFAWDVVEGMPPGFAPRPAGR